MRRRIAATIFRSSQLVEYFSVIMLYERLTKDSRVLMWCCVASLLARLALTWAVYPNFNAIEDFRIAGFVAAGKGFVNQEHLGATAFKAPAYPYFLAGLILAFGQWANLAAALLQHCVAAFTPLLIRRLGQSAGLARAGTFAAWGFLLHPTYFYYPCVLEPTTLTVALGAMWAERGLALRQQGRSATSAQFGVLSGILVLLQPVSIPIVAAGLLGFPLVKRGKRGFGWQSAVLSCCIAAAVAAPWTIRNYVVFDAFIPVKSPFWMNIYEGFMPENHGTARFDIIPASEKQRIDSLSQTLNDVAMEREYRVAAQRAIADNPVMYIEKCAYQAWLLWTFPPRYFTSWTVGFLLVRLLPVILLSVFTLAGAGYLYRANPVFARSIAAALLYITVVYAATHAANIRFKLDIEWVQLFAAGAYFEGILRRRVEKLPAGKKLD